MAMNILLVPIAALAALSSSPVTLASTQASAVVDSTGLLPGEVKLEIAAKGETVSRADKATLQINLRCTGATLAEARAQVRSTADKIVTELVRRGVPRANIVADAPTNQTAFVVSEAVDQIAAAAYDPKPANPQSKPQRSASMVISIKLTDVSLLSRIRTYFEEIDAAVLQNPSYELSDDRSARNAAIADAMRNARLDAESYAASANMRVARILAIRDRAAQPSVFPNYEEMIERFANLKGESQPEVKTTASVVVEFALVPR
jgi:uncharacterized protein YggE